MPGKIIDIKGFTCARIKARGPVLYYMSDFDLEYEICSIYWKVEFGGKSYLIDTGIKDIGYINSTTKSGYKWERLDGIKNFDSLDYIFPTHLHYDHCSGIYDYDASIIMTRKAYGNIMDEKYSVLFSDKIFNNNILDRIRNRDNCHFVSEGMEVEPDVVVQWVGGHTPCSQVIIFRSDFRFGGKGYKGILFSGDIAFTYRNIEEKIPGGLVYSLMDFYDFYDRYTGEGFMIIPGHDCIAVKKVESLRIRDKDE